MRAKRLTALIIAMVVAGAISLGLVAAAWIADWPTAGGWNMVTHQVGLGTVVVALLALVVFGVMSLHR
jgi:hypothetical protein